MTNGLYQRDFSLEPEDNARQARALRQQMRGVARQASLDPGDGMEL